MPGFWARLLVIAIGLLIASELVSGIEFSGMLQLFFAALVLGGVNAIVRPIIVVLTIPLTIATLVTHAQEETRDLRPGVSIARQAVIGMWQLDARVEPQDQPAHHGFNLAGLRLGEFHRPQATADLYAKIGKGIKNSNHCKKLAADLFLVKDGKVTWEHDDYRPLGERWESMHDLCRWGGRFKNRDAVHFSLEHNGVA